MKKLILLLAILTVGVACSKEEAPLTIYTLSVPTSNTAVASSTFVYIAKDNIIEKVVLNPGESITICSSGKPKYVCGGSNWAIAQNFTQNCN